MKNIIIILGLIILTSATTASVNMMTIKPMTPIKTVSYGTGGYGCSNASKAATWINKMAVKGFIVKLTVSDENGILVVMEKY